MTKKNHFDGTGYVESFNSLKSTLPGADVSWLNDFRKVSIGKFKETGLPGPKVEEWKYSNLNILKNGPFEASSKNVVMDDKDRALFEKAIFQEIAGPKVVFIDGYYNAELSNIKNQHGVTLKGLNEFIKSDPDKARTLFTNEAGENSLGNLNMALMTGGFVVIIDENVKLAEPIQTIHVATRNATGKSLRQRNFIHLEKNSKGQIIESFVGVNDVNCWAQNVTNIIIDKKADLEIYQYQIQGNKTVHMDETRIDVAEGASFKHYSLNIGAILSRTEIKPTLKGIAANVELSGAFLGRGGNLHDVFSHMKHMVPEGISNQNYRGVLDKGGKSAFQGKVYVAKDAQLTNANQSNKNLLLDRGAEANSKPELLIYADDVKCSHGATVGELDAEALFYLKSRGLDQLAAKALLVEAFVAEVFDKIELEPVRTRYLELARTWLEGAK